MKRASPLLLVALFLVGIFIVPVGVANAPARLPESLPDNETFEYESEPSWLPTDTNVRIAIYNETNSTMPSYTTGGTNTNYTMVHDLFVNAGYEVTGITFQNIQNHELVTADYDVLVLADNLPRENITDFVREFWLGGGGILSMDSAAGYLGYAGILPREDYGVDDGKGTYWAYSFNSIANITTRHPATKSHALGEQLTIMDSDWCQYNWSALMNTSIAADLTKLAVDDDDANWVHAVAMDPTDMGGKVVHLGIPIGFWQSDWEDIMIDSVEWLCPRQKGRVLFDLSHMPYYGVDEWEDSAVKNPNKYNEWRNALVNKTYTFDKLWPSEAGNLTSNNLASYDMLIIVMPDINFTASEVQAVTDWVDTGGSLLILGDKHGYSDSRARINELLGFSDLEWNSTHNEQGSSTVFADHPICEDLTEVFPAAGGVVNTQGDAVPIVITDNNDVIVGADEYGSGRVAMVSDINIFDPIRIQQPDNLQLSVNLANWLISWDAEVLVYQSASVPEGESGYRSALSRALNELGVDYMLHLDAAYFNLSLNSKEWDMVIVDSNYISPVPNYEYIQNYLENGGKLIMRDFFFAAEAETSLYDVSLFGYLGFNGTGTTITSGPPSVYLWNGAHSIFNEPIGYGANNISSNNNRLLTDFTHVTLFDNATALAGITESPQENQSAIVLSVGGRALCNMFALAEYTNDTDDSAYPDNYEFWLNEIAFMMRPTVDNPSDMSIEAKSTGESITWTPTSDRPYSYKIERDSVEVESGSWDGGQIIYELEEDSLGLIEFELTVYDSAGSSASDTVMVTVADTTYPAFVDAPDNLLYEEGTAEHLVNWSFTDDFPDSWVFYINGTIEDSGAWEASEISVDAGGLSAGVWNLTLAVNDTSDNLATSTVYLTVTESSTTTTITTTTTETTTTTTGETTTTTSPPADMDTNLILIAAVVGAVVVLVILFWMRKR